MRKATTTSCVLLMVLWVLSGCGGPHESRSEGSPLCDALNAHVPGIGEIVWDNGITSQEATWGTLLDAGITESDAATRRNASDAVRADTEGFDRVLDAAPQSLRPDLERLRSLLLDPGEVKARRADPEVVESIHKVVDASPPEVCDWVR